MKCVVCGYECVSQAMAEAAVADEYTYSAEEIGAGVLRVAHTDCAVADGWIDIADGADFHFQFRPTAR